MTFIFRTRRVVTERWGTCKICNRRVNGTSRTHGTNQLRKHAAAYKKRLAELQSLQTASFVALEIAPIRPSTAQVSTYDPSRGREAVSRLIVGAELPISFGQNPFFEDFMKTFVPNYQSLSRGTIRSDILALFNKKN